MSGPSDKAKSEAAMASHKGIVSALRAAHDPALGPKRSVCYEDLVAEIVEALRNRGDDPPPSLKSDGAIMSWSEDYGPGDAADFIEREFRGGS